MGLIKGFIKGVASGVLILSTGLNEIEKTLSTILNNQLRYISNLNNKTKIKIYPAHGAFQYPEITFPEVYKKPNTGVAFSGGGNRSSSLTIGYLRGLHHIKLQDQIRYTGSISGGSWAIVPYTYLPRQYSDQSFLGNYIAPENLTLLAMREQTGEGSFPKLIAKSEFFKRLHILFLNALEDEESDQQFSELLSSIYLDYYKLHEDRFAGFSESVTSRITERNDHLNKHDFYHYERDRPYMCVNGAMNTDYVQLKNEGLVNISLNVDFLSWEHVDFTPLYSGIHRESTGNLNYKIGGGYVENVGWDTWRHPDNSNLPKEMIRIGIEKDNKRLSPKDIMAISGAAPAYLYRVIAETIGPLITNSLGMFPRFIQWPVRKFEPKLSVERTFGDGGYTDQYGIIPLLKRKVQNIVVYINTDERITKNTNWPGDTKLDTYLAILFGYNVNKIGGEPDWDPFNPADFLGRKNLGKVFEKNEYVNTVRGLYRSHQIANTIKYPKPLPAIVTAENFKQFKLSDTSLNPKDYEGIVPGVTYHRQTYKVLKNQFFGIQSGWQTTIVWVYNDTSKIYEDLLQSDVKQSLASNFPFISTFSQNKSTLKLKEQRIWSEEIPNVSSPLSYAFKKAGIDKWLRDFDPIDLNPDQVSSLTSIASWRNLRLQPVLNDLFAEEKQVSLREMTENFKVLTHNLSQLEIQIAQTFRNEKIQGKQTSGSLRLCKNQANKLEMRV